MKNLRSTLKLVFCTTLLGSLFGMLLYNHYLDDMSVFHDSTNFFFLQEGAYSSVELVRVNTRNLNTKLVVEDNGIYNVYVAITRDRQVKESIKRLYSEKNIELVVKEKNLQNLEFQSNIDQFDLLLRNSTTIEEVNSISAVALSNFEQTIMID